VSPATSVPPLCAVILAAGVGKRLRPLTDIRPKALCPVGNVPLLDLALDSVRPYVADVAVNVHHLAEQVYAHLDGSGVHVSDERDGLLQSGGALGHLREWIAGRAVLLRNADAYLTSDLGELVAGWDGRRPRILAIPRGIPSDFGDVQYVGACLLPASDALRMPDAPASVNDLVWQPAWGRGELEVVEVRGEFVDCGTPRDYLRANLLASGGASVVGQGATVLGALERVVVWPGGHVGPDEALHDCIRIGAELTVDAY
jgi:N-acetyl-alpha-D-muramate 1-phosphate uridylyltransferase